MVVRVCELVGQHSLGSIREVGDWNLREQPALIFKESLRPLDESGDVREYPRGNDALLVFSKPPHYKVRKHLRTRLCLRRPRRANCHRRPGVEHVLMLARCPVRGAIALGAHPPREREKEEHFVGDILQYE